MTVVVAEDRSMCVQPNQVVRTAWVDIDLCRLSFRVPMGPEAVEKNTGVWLNLGECAPWPPIVGTGKTGGSSIAKACQRGRARAAGTIGPGFRRGSV
jgi:hypothetical protein